MDLILRDKNFVKKKIIKKPLFSCSCGFYGISANDFSLKLSDSELLNVGEIVTYGFSEYGGYISRREVDTANQAVTYTGKTFRGQLENFIVTPESETEYNGTVFEIVSQIIESAGIGYGVSFDGSEDEKTVTIPLGSNALKAIDLVLSAFGKKMKIKVASGVTVFFENAGEKTFDETQVPLVFSDDKSLPTALHAYSNGASASAYLQQDGSIGSTPYYTGFEAVEIWQEISTNDSTYLSELAADKLAALRTVQNGSELTVEGVDIGDKIIVSAKRYCLKETQTANEITMDFDGTHAVIKTHTGG